jgi:hypothetical protein
MFPFPITRGGTPAERNAQRNERVISATDDAITALNSMLTELRTLRTALTSDEWAEAAEHGSYHRAEYVGRQFDAAGHGLRRFYEASVLACTTAGGYEDEPKTDNEKG